MTNEIVDNKNFGLYLYGCKTAVEALAPVLLAEQKGVFVGLATPYPIAVSKLTLHNIRTNRFFFVDYASKKQGKNLLFENNVVFASDLHELGVAIQTLTRNYGTVFFDDVSALFLYHSFSQVKNFFQALISRLDKKRVYVFGKQHHTPQEFIDVFVSEGKSIVNETP